MTIRKVTEKDRGAFNKKAGHPLQSWEWGEFREKTGNKIIRLARYNPSTSPSTLSSGPKGSGRSAELTEAMQVIFSHIPHTNLKIGTVIRGPKPTKEIIEELKKLGNEEKAIFIKLEPNFATAINGRKKELKDAEGVLKLLRDSSAVGGRTLFTPTSFWIDLTKSEEELLKSFHSKARYNIRLAQRKGVEVVEDNSKKAFERYIELTRDTVERQEFYAHTEKYHRLMWQVLHEDMVKAGDEPIARLLTARYNPPATPERSDGGRGGEIITTWILFVWHDFVYYPYGASSDKYRNVMASNLIMWEAIRYGKKLGLKTFDLWGREPGKGFTKFKEGYSPQVVEFLGTWDLVVDKPIYHLYRIAEAIRWKTLRIKAKLFPTEVNF